MKIISGGNELRRRLREADPLAAEGPPSADAMQEVRRAILAAAAQPPASRTNRYATLALAATLAIAAALGVAAARHFAAGAGTEAVPPRAASIGTAERTQVQFSTPGGTRIIWTIDPAFRLTEAP
jgi:hypothetical protein